MEDTRIMVTIFTGMERKAHEIVVPIAALLARELSEPMEVSDEPFSILLAAYDPTGRSAGKDYIETRKCKFRMREDVAKQVAAALTATLVDHFGRNDVRDGYRKE